MADNTAKFRLINDPIHGHIKLNKVCQLIVDTEHFQRLRDIKQLGVVDFVFPGATHTRFEHALGTYHLAGKFVRKLKKRYPNIINDRDVLCVEIAGLCHDLGYGPFSTLFSKRFLPRLTHIKLRNRSSLIFQHMLKKYNLQPKLVPAYLQEGDLTFIKELIDGYKTTGSTAWPYEGRTKEYAFLYEIVENLRNGIDVCKFDYMARDCQNLGISNSFDAHRYMEIARILEVDGERQICTRETELNNLYSMFFTRYNLHKFAYQHPVVCGIELLIVDILEAIKDKPLIKVGSDDWLDLSTILQDLMEASNANDIMAYDRIMTGYIRLTDGFLYSVRHCRPVTEQNKNVPQNAQNLIERLCTRDIYRCVYESKPALQCMPEADLRTTLLDGQAIIKQEDIKIMIIELDFGMKDENPMDRLRVYTKDKLEEAIRMQERKTSRLLDGMNYKELLFRVYAIFPTKDGENSNKLESLKTLCNEKFENKAHRNESLNN